MLQCVGLSHVANSYRSQLLISIEPYTEKHRKRIASLLQQSFLIDYTLSAMQLLTPVEELENVEELDNVLMNGHDETEERGTEQSVSVGVKRKKKKEKTPRKATKRVKR